ncbi:hypothetical protein AVEN_57863-1 [Araneus ventricosus]|uniref:Uncharacterized protein n=1 Tax=Araneus ventricosus TaxID=182803 RepID=A0A4Y2K3N3_ARAVE|nr:hypothetical protein AVEN_232120-1 [Araneus ventricosus]GBM95968.1 hypothetical protein AVEN_20870-1 [Araneus ventricosus]GBM95971.1 hypothetical protein AVEN_32388-1 [Araneus ventricosus]GBM95988.1 hypothetical protein AVEN_57863-1 [Araneus ventricosus]
MTPFLPLLSSESQLKPGSRKCDILRRTNTVFTEHFILKKNKKKKHAHTPKKHDMFCRTIKARRSLCQAFSLHVAAFRDWSNGKNNSPSSYGLQESTPSSGLMPLGLKIQNKYVESRLQKSSTELQILNVCLGFK